MSNEYKLKHLKIVELKEAAYNPKRRTGKTQLAALKKSIETVGLVYPLAVNAKNELIDGHRRLAVCKSLGWEEVPVVVVAGDRDMIYAEVNAASVKLSGNDLLNVYLSNPGATMTRTRKYFENVEGVIGRALLEQMARKGYSIGLFRIAKQAAAYCESAQNGEFVKKTIRWMIQHKSMRILNSAMIAQTPGEIVERAIRKNVPLAAKYQMQK